MFCANRCWLDTGENILNTKKTIILRCFKRNIPKLLYFQKCANIISIQFFTYKITVCIFNNFKSTHIYTLHKNLKLQHDTLKINFLHAFSPILILREREKENTNAKKKSIVLFFEIRIKEYMHVELKYFFFEEICCCSLSKFVRY